MQRNPRVAVIGAGTMGHGIAEAAATSGFEVALCDIAPELLERGLSAIRESLGRAVDKRKISATERDAALGRIRTTVDLADAVADAEIVFEAAPERLDVKREIFERIDRMRMRVRVRARAHAEGEGAADAPAVILATNTSSLSITRIAEAVGDPSRVVGMHFFNPAPVMELVEIVRGKKTSDETVAAAREYAARMGKTAIVVKDVPGFASSRLGVCLGAEAMRMFEQGVASAEDIDRAMELGYRHPMGPLRLTDLVGLDVRLAILEHLHQELGEVFRPPEILRRLVSEGKLGKKVGEGFYKWDP